MVKRKKRKSIKKTTKRKYTIRTGLPAATWRILNGRILNDENEILKDMEEADPVNHPAHYKKGSIETILVIEDITQFYPASEAYNIGNVIRYISRAVHKGNKQEDLEKAQWYLDRLVGHPGKGQV